MSIPAKELLSLKSKNLKDILLQCGWSTSGTKPVMVQQILAQAPKSRLMTYSRSKTGLSIPSRSQPKEHRVLSIDMGIKNLALCLLKFQSDKIALAEPVVPEILAWNRFSVLDRVSDQRPLVSDNVEDTVKTPTSVTAPSSADFSAASLAPVAASLARDFIHDHAPTLILIEAQRYRSMGSSAVQEWTLRVNKLEAMLHAILLVLREEGVWKVGSTCSINPQRTTGFWLSQETSASNALPKNTDSSRRIPRKKAVDTKLLKINLVREWLNNGQAIKVDKGNKALSGIVNAFLETKGRSKISAVGKLDDLADCLLQGLALVRWEQNRLQFLSKWSSR